MAYDQQLLVRKATERWSHWPTDPFEFCALEFAKVSRRLTAGPWGSGGAVKPADHAQQPGALRGLLRFLTSQPVNCHLQDLIKHQDDLQQEQGTYLSKPGTLWATDQLRIVYLQPLTVPSCPWHSRDLGTIQSILLLPPAATRVLQVVKATFKAAPKGALKALAILKEEPEIFRCVVPLLTSIVLGIAHPQVAQLTNVPLHFMYGVAGLHTARMAPLCSSSSTAQPFSSPSLAAAGFPTLRLALAALDLPRHPVKQSTIYLGQRWPDAWPRAKPRQLLLSL
jgi:hypothetical protein